eukprot:CAMPEP_0202350716 /NCGR_PEP_ID=MMETSP1126-20121109/7673_1 /ASSEMBLY_ACC=CAM_ASM_000457 /TAXON_ID=3047 /ORGANISM="Dunaliella tertiolecta, Strain CCMP1320" /LENGTH=319 /DNA_ID=CAMNT_0048942735 /DNA_START=88 /DNA_END=1048 /DNA_ORIENTATION=+
MWAPLPAVAGEATPEDEARPLVGRPSLRLHCSTQEGTTEACWEVIRCIEQVVRERESANRRKRIAAYRHELERLMKLMPPEQAEDLEAQLKVQRMQRSQRSKQRLAKAMVEGPHIVVDCSFAPTHCKPGVESRSLAKQVEAAMAYNRRLDRPLAIHCTSWGGEVAQFGNYIGAQNWPVMLHTESLLDLFDPSRVIVLSPDAEEPMLEFDPDKVYVIGGIVDRTIRKGVTSTFAAEHGMQARRLPIAEHIEALQIDSSRSKSPCLNVSDVAIALCTLWQEGDWRAALELAVSQRKRKPQQAKPKKVRPTRESNELGDGCT